MSEDTTRWRKREGKQKNSEIYFKMFGGFIRDVDGLHGPCGKDTGPTGFQLGERAFTLH